MEWIVKIEGQKNQRIVVKYDPLEESVSFTGEYRINNNWHRFTKTFHIVSAEPGIEDIQETMEKVVVDLRIRIKQHENLDKGFGVIKEISFLEDEEQD